MKNECEPSHVDGEVQIPKESESNGSSRPFLEMPEEYYQEKINEFSSKISNPSRNKKIIYTQGVFDLFHSGHVDFLEKCKTSVENGFLVVGILTDEEVHRVYGGYPVTNTYERALALLSCKFVGQVKIGVPYEITSQFVDDLKVISLNSGSATHKLQQTCSGFVAMLFQLLVNRMCSHCLFSVC
jgi:cytidyltransferase-like protein